MSAPGPPYNGRPERSDQAELEPVVPPGRQAVLLAALAIGVVMLGMQLWLLTVALDLYLGGESGGIWALAAFSGVVFVGGLAALRILSKQPPLRRR